MKKYLMFVIFVLAAALFGQIPNYLHVRPLSSDTAGMIYVLDSCERLTAIPDTTSVDSIFIFLSADSAALASTFSTALVPIDTMIKSQIRMNGCPNNILIGGLISSEKYYVGLAVKSTSGVWSERINIRSFWTRPSNRIRIAAAVTPQRADSSILCTLYNVSSLKSNIDTIKLFTAIGTYQTNPLWSPDTSFPRAIISGDTFIVKFDGMGSNRKYFITATCGVSQIADNTVRWGTIATESGSGNGDTVRTGDYSAPTTPDFQLWSVTTSSANFSVPPSFVYSSNTDSVKFYIGTDSAAIAANYRLLVPLFPRDTAGARNSMLVDTLRDGAVYWIGVASKSKEGIWSGNARIKKVITGVSNNLTVKWKRINNGAIQIKIGGVGTLSQNAEYIKLWNKSKQAGGYQIDSSAAADTLFPISYPFANDTITDTLDYSQGVNDTFFLSVTAGFSGNWASITELNRASVYIDNLPPVNLLALGATDSTASSITYSVGNATFPSDVDSFWVWLATDSVSLVNSFNSRTGFYSSLPKTSLIGNTLTSLSEMRRYWIGVALRDKMGNWSASLSVISRHTKPVNPLSVEITESGTSGILRAVIHGHRQLNPVNVDTVRLFYRTDAALFNPRTYDPAQLKYSMSLASVLSDSVILLPNMEGETRYYFAVNERAVVNGIVLYGDISSSPNTVSFETGDYAEPQNASILVAETFYDSIHVRLTDVHSVSLDVASVFVYISTDKNVLSDNYRTIAAADTLSRPEALASSIIAFKGLVQGTRYYVGVAVRDSSGNWSTSLSIDSSRTTLENTLTPVLDFTASDNRRISVAGNGIAALSSRADSIKVYYGTSQILDPYAAYADTIVSRQNLNDGIHVSLADGISSMIYVSLAPFVSENGNRFFSDIPLTAVRSVWFDSDEPFNPLGLRIVDSSLTSVTVEATNWAILVGTDVDSVHFWARKRITSSDSNYISTQHINNSPSVRLSLAQLVGGTNAVISGLDTGAVYYVAVAPKDTNGNYSVHSNIGRYKSASRPLNPVSLTGSAPNYNVARLTMTNLSALASNIDRSRIKVLLSTVNYNINGYDSTDTRYFNVGTDSAQRTFLVTGLKQSTKYFVTVAVSNLKGYWSGVATPLNSCTLRTPAAADTIAPSTPGITFVADTSPYIPYTQIYYKIRGLNTISAEDRYTGGVRIYWSESGYYTDFQYPSQGVGFADIPLATMALDSAEGLLYPLKAGSILSGSGRRYYLSMSIRDSAYNWDTLGIKTAIGYTVLDTVRPVNDTLWNPVISGYSRIVLNWRPSAFNKAGATFRDTVTRLGVWLSTSPVSQQHVDSATPFFTFDSGSTSPVYIDGLKHNTTYYAAFAPINTFDNRGRIVNGKSLFQLDVPFDSSTIAPTPNLCTLKVSHASVPESLKVIYKLSALQFTDPVNSVVLPVKQIIIRYRSDGIYPSSPTDGLLARTINIGTALADSFFFSPVQLGSDYRFSAFVVSSLPSSYPNRFSPVALYAQAAIRTWSYPVNNLAITRLLPQGGFGQPVRVAIDWRIATGAIPSGVRFLYRQYVGYDDVPVKYNTPGFGYFEPGVLAYSRRDTVPVVLKESTKYLVAAFVRNSDGIWSKTCVWDTVTTPRGIDTVGPTRLPLEVTTRVVDCRTVRVKWRIDRPLFESAQFAENGKLSLLLDWNNDGPSYFLAPTINKPYRDSGRIAVQRHIDSVLITDLEPNKDYYFAMSTADSVGNQAATDSLSLSFVKLQVPPMADSLTEFYLTDNERYSLQWSNALNLDGNRWNADPQVKFIAYVIQSDSAYTGPMPSYEVSTANSISRCEDILIKSISERALRFDERNHYLTVWPAVDRFLYPGAPHIYGPFRYKIDQPWLSKIETMQISDTVVRLILVPNDSTERDIQVRVTYSMDGGASYSPIPASALRNTPSFVPLLDTIVSGTACTAFVHVNRLPSNYWNSVKGADTARIFLRVALSDMRPVTQLLPDTVFTVTRIIDNRPPSNAAILINYNRSTRRLNVSVSASGQGELSSLLWKGNLAEQYRTLPFTGTSILIDTIGLNAIYLRLVDSIGNFLDTSWSDFQFVRLPFKDSLYNTGKRSFDNGSFSVEVPITAINPVSLNNGFLTVGLSANPVDSVQLRSLGFNRYRPETYFILTELRATTTGTHTFYNSGINLSFRMPSADTAVRLYRFSSGYKFEELRTIIDSGGRILRIDSLAPSTHWNSINTSVASANDTVYIVALRDLRAPLIDTAGTGLYLSGKGDSGSIRIRVRDNNIRLDAGVRLFTYNPNNLFSDTVLWDTSTTAFLSGTRTALATTPDTLVECTFDVTQILRNNMAKIRTSGVHFGIWVDDGRKRAVYASAPVSVDSIVGSYVSLRPNWSIVSITATPSEHTTIIDAIPELNGVYNRDRVRIMRLEGNKFVEFTPQDHNFRIVPGRAFIATVRSEADAALKFRLNESKLPAIKNNRGYVLATGGTTGGWRLVSLPFMGSVRQSAIVNASRLDTTTGRLSMYQRMWTLKNNLFQHLNPVPALGDSVRLRSVRGYGEGVLLYVYPNEEIVAPIIDKGSFAFNRTMAKKGDVAEWSISFSVSSINSDGSISGADAMNSIGVSASAHSFDDLVFPYAPVAGVLDNGVLKSLQMKQSGSADSGWIWKILVKNTDKMPKGLRIDFGNTGKFPDGYSIVLDNPDGGYAVDICDTGASFSDNFSALESREFSVVVGDSSFVARNSSKGRMPKDFSVSGNYPNPFNPVTAINYTVPVDKNGNGYSGCMALLQIFDLRGRLVSTLVDGAPRAGRHTVLWNSTGQNGNYVASGIYLYRLKVMTMSGRMLFAKTMKMTLIK